MGRRFVVAGLAVSLAALGVALGAALADAPPDRVALPPQATAPDLAAVLPAAGEDAGGDGERHGGPIERFHGAGRCDLVDLGGFPGNWTHGDYVSAVAALGDAALVPIAAKSDCGKPMVSVGKGGPPDHAGGGGPPDHALEKKANAPAGGPPEDVPVDGGGVAPAPPIGS